MNTSIYITRAAQLLRQNGMPGAANLFLAQSPNRWAIAAAVAKSGHELLSLRIEALLDMHFTATYRGDEEKELLP